MLHNLSTKPGVHQNFLSRLRSIDFQENKADFRKNMERLGQILAYEISRELPFRKESVQTPLGIASAQVPAAHPVLCCILRAGLPFYYGFQDYFFESSAGFIGAYRGKSGADNSFEIEMLYEALPPVAGQPLILIDPMLATGKSMLMAAEKICSSGNPSQLIFASLIASPEGCRLLETAFPQAGLWTIAVDEGLNEKSYILPGLGDAGDLSFGPKMS
jgi:uracil phosphoribosyltransferase